jgi:hypothetical protein
VHKRLRVVATQRSAALSTADHYMRSVAHPTQTDSLLATLQRWNASPRVKSGSDAPAAAVSTLLLPSLYAVLSHHAWSVGAAKVLKPKRKMTLRVCPFKCFTRFRFVLPGDSSPPAASQPHARAPAPCLKLTVAPNRLMITQKMA